MSAFTLPTGRKLTWLITGCSSGFGLSLARLVQAQGHNLIATSRNPSRTESLVKEVESKGGKWIALDVTSPDSAKVIQQLEQSGAKIDVLVNNAGFCNFAPVETATDKDIRDQVETLFLGSLRLIQAVIPFMRDRKFGVIANLSSGAALDGNPTMGPYAGAKAGLDATSRVLAKEVASFNIRVLTLITGMANTNFGQAASFSNSFPEAYNGTMVEKMIVGLQSGKVPVRVDKDKAMQSVFDIISTNKSPEVGTVLLGPDMVERIKGVQAAYVKVLDAFEESGNATAYQP